MNHMRDTASKRYLDAPRDPSPRSVLIGACIVLVLITAPDWSAWIDQKLDAWAVARVAGRGR